MASSSSDFLNDLAKRPLGHKLGILAGVLAAVGLLYWQFFYSGLKDDLSSAERKKQRLLKESKDYDKDLDEQKKLNEQIDQLRAIIAANQKALPTEAELPAFFDHIQKKAGEAGVSIKSWDRKDEVSVDDYIKVPVEVAIEGTYYQIVKYFALLGPMAKGAGSDVLAPEGEDALDKPEADRLVSIENLNISSAEVRNDEVILNARFFASTFRQAGDPDAPAVEPRPSAPRKDAKQGAKPDAAEDATKPPANAKDRAEQKVEDAKDEREKKTDDASKKADPKQK